jgi:hypothetical protein
MPATFTCNDTSPHRTLGITEHIHGTETSPEDVNPGFSRSLRLGFAHSEYFLHPPGDLLKGISPIRAIDLISLFAGLEITDIMFRE